MKDISHFKCQRCGEDRSHYCLGMCNRCYQRHLREKNKDRKVQPSGVFSLKRKKNNYPFTAPLIGENYQTTIPEKTSLSPLRSYKKAYNYSDSDNIEKFLKFCKLIYSEYPAEGDIIKGACGIEERAMNLLEQYGDLHKAMYAVKNPIVLALNPDLIESLPADEIEKEVNQVWNELHKVKIDNKDEFLEKLKISVDSGITEQEFHTLLQIASNMKVKVPKEITSELSESENFSKTLRKKKVDKSLTVEELREVVARFEDFKIKTSTMQEYQEILAKAEDWMARFRKNTHPTMRQLQNMVTEGTALPLSIPELAVVRDKHKSVKKWTETVHGLIKTWRCKKDVKTPLSEVQSLVQEAKGLQFTHHDILILEDAAQKVFEWQERVKMTEEDKYCSEFISQLLEEGQNLPLEVDSLEGMKNAFNWTARAKKVLESKKINQKVLAQLANEGKNKAISSPMLKEMQNLLNCSKLWREKAKKVLASSDNNVELMQDLLKEAEGFLIDEECYVAQLRNKVNKLLEIRDMKKGSKKTTAEVRNSKRPSISFASEYDEIKHQAKLPEAWPSATSQFLKKFPKPIPNAEDLPTLKKLIEEVPSSQKSSSDYSKLLEMLDNSSTWIKESNQCLDSNDSFKINSLIAKSSGFPVDLVLYEKLNENVCVSDWKVKVSSCLHLQDIQSLKKLKAEIPSLAIKGTSEYQELSSYLENYEKWSNDLEKVCDDGSLETLEDLYRASKDLAITHEQRTLIKRSIISMYSWKDRVKYYLDNGGEISEGRALAKEGEYVCFECDEQDELSALLEKLKVIKKKVRKVLFSLPNSAIRSQITPRVFKKRHVLEEYKLENKQNDENQVADLVQAVESACETIAPMEPYAFPLYHPIQGLSLIISIPTQAKQVRLPDDKKKRPISYKQLNEDGKNIKRPPRRPKNFEISRQSFCICKNEASWNDTIMINCDYCGEWYHPTCISIDSEEIEKIDEFCCFLCYERIGIRSERVKRQIIPYNEFLNLVQECSGKFWCDEIREILKIDGRIAEWRVEAKELLETGLMVKELKKIYEVDSSLIEEQQYLFDGKIMKSLVEYEGLPAIMEERDLLLNLLRKRDWLREAYQSIYKKNSYRNIKKLVKERGNFDEESFSDAVAELNKVLVVIQEYNNQLQDILKGQPTLTQLKKFFENEEIVHYKLDLFEKTKKKVEQFEAVLQEIKEEMNAKDKKKLAGLVAKAEKLGIKDGLLDEAIASCGL